MIKKMTHEEVGAYFRSIVLAVAVRFLGAGIWCATVMNLWRWFVVPMHSTIPMLSAHVALGLWLLVTVFRGWKAPIGEFPSTAEEAEKVFLRAVTGVVYMLGALGVGWLLQWIGHG